MKKRILPALILAFISASSLHAQVEKGKLLLGGSVGFSTSNSSFHTTTSNAGISPRIGYAIGRNSVVGVFGSFNNNVEKSTASDDRITNTNFSVNAYWRKYLPIQNKLGWYTELNGGYYRSTRKQKIQGVASKLWYTGYTVGAVPGVYYQVMPQLLLNANVGGVSYNHGKQDADPGESTSKNSNFSVSFLNYFGIGVDFILGKRS